MNLPFHIARRYLFSKKKQNVINIISLISVVGVMVGTMALVIVLSAFNGLNQFIDQQFSCFDPDLKILPAKGKTFVPDSIFGEIKNMEQVVFFSEVLEENALLKYGNRQRPAIVKGVDENFSLMTGIDTMMTDGNFVLDTNKYQFAVLGYGVAFDLGVGLTFVDPIKFYVPKRNAKVGHNPMNAFNTEIIWPSGFFQVQPDFDTQYTLVPLSFARKLFSYQNEVSAIELGINDSADIDEVKSEIQEMLGDDFQVKNRYELHDVIYKMMKTEKAAVFFILAFILVIASFNIIGSLTMLILDKKEDVSTLRSLGANEQTIRQLFLIEGCLISFSGALLGVVLGIIVCYLQIKFGFVKLAAGSFFMNSYPVNVHLSDIFIIFITVVLIGYFASRFPVQYITKRYLQFN
ncbi:ABC transporter permease [Marinifilum flexuosum]|uniref:Lipoprotein-releasing system permease protein n=1 Tax=Marinifilum flexuosum TaxID=1117708 RepID=A0A419X699_9BACT|nr:FtsX-like permease family protein [Marinifilum flexuosum]RKE03268.1 lipoprotein-releasing system permease protein [Marinifilum flexuosum]